MTPEQPLSVSGKSALTSSSRPAWARWITPACLLVGAIGIVLIWSARSHHKRPRTHHSSRTFPFPPVMAPMMGSHGPQGFRDGMYPRIQPRPLFVANFADRTGPYTVSVRQVIAEEYQSTLHTNVTQLHQIPALNALRISMQIMSPSEAALDHVLAFTTRCSGEDDRGNRLTFAPLRSRLRFAGGIGVLLTVAGFSPQARAIKHLKGEVLISDRPIVENSRATPPDAPYYQPMEMPSRRAMHEEKRKTDGEYKVSRTLPFALENIPLPNVTHVFGLAAAAPVPASAMRKWKLSMDGHLASPRLLSEGAEKPLLSLLPPSTPLLGPLKQPIRLILPLALPATFTVPFSDKLALTCQVTTNLNAGGKIAFHLKVRQPGNTHAYERDVLAWDNVPQVMLLPTEKGVIALFLNLYLDLPPTSENSVNQAVFPFMAPLGKQGGTIVGKTTVTLSPLCLGVLDMEIREEATGATTQFKVALDQDGNYRFANVKPGRYTLRLKNANPYFSQITPGLSLAEYARERWHLQNPQWNATAQSVEVRAGGYSLALPWTLQEKSSAVAVTNQGR